LAEQWLIEDSNTASDRLELAAQAASTTADRTALGDLKNQYRNLQEWNDQLIEAKQSLQLAQLYMSPEGLKNALLFQKTVECGNSRGPVRARGRLREDNACR